MPLKSFPHFILFIILISSYGGASEFERLYEVIAEDEAFETEGEEDSDVYYLLERYYQTPLDLNRASAKELGNLPRLRPGVIGLIIERREKRAF